MEHSPTKDPINPTTRITPIHEKQSNTQNSPELTTSRVEENTIALNQIEGHSLTAEDRRRRDHILYNLPNLNDLPRCSSASMTYLSASQRQLRQEKDNSMAEAEETEIQSRLRVAEERIANVPINLFNRFQILQRGARGAPSTTKSL